MTGNLQALCKVRIAMREHFLCPRIFSVYIIFVLDEDYNDDIRLCKWLCSFLFLFLYIVVISVRCRYQQCVKA
uniref:Uncharacterized protein n=1 Tax=Anguilla anguilla TaxID=7936 RepID=A0A0E9X2D3_ANGAN